MEKSVHTSHQITCEKCHGGDPTAKESEAAKAPGTNFIGVPNKVQIAEMCGNCHADVATMNFYNIPTDQLARYKTSAHGKRLFQEGDEKVAACSDCHGYHDVVAVGDSSSPVYPLNLPNTCNRCHGKEKLMTPYGHPVDILEKYTQSVHGKALFEKNDLSAANCAKCHGSHGAVPPGVKEIHNTCGKCHINEKKYFLESPHGKISDGEKFSECLTCHGYHDVKKADLVIYKEKCVQCHESDSGALKQGMGLLSMLEGAEKKYEEMKGLVQQASIDGIFIEPEEAKLQRIRSSVIEMAPAQHTLSTTVVEQEYNNVVTLAEEISSSIQKKRKALIWRKIGLIPLWIFIFIMCAALNNMYHHLKRLRNYQQFKRDQQDKQDKTKDE